MTVEFFLISKLSLCCNLFKSKQTQNQSNKTVCPPECVSPLVFPLLCPIIMGGGVDGVVTPNFLLLFSIPWKPTTFVSSVTLFHSDAQSQPSVPL